MVNGRQIREETGKNRLWFYRIILQAPNGGNQLAQTRVVFAHPQWLQGIKTDGAYFLEPSFPFFNLTNKPGQMFTNLILIENNSPSHRKNKVVCREVPVGYEGHSPTRPVAALPGKTMTFGKRESLPFIASQLPASGFRTLTG